MQEPAAVHELVGVLGLPGAAAGLVFAFYYGAKTWQLFSGGRKISVNGNTAVSYKDATAMTDSVRQVVDASEHVVMENINVTRHDINNGLVRVVDELTEHAEKQTDRVVDKLGDIARLIELGIKR